MNSISDDTFLRRVVQFFIVQGGTRGMRPERELHLSCGHVQFRRVLVMETSQKYSYCDICRQESLEARPPLQLTAQELLVQKYQQEGRPLMDAVRDIMEAEGR